VEGASGVIRMTDDNLIKDLAAIDEEVKRRKKANPSIPYAFWALTERLDAMSRYEHRQEKQTQVIA